MIFFEHVLNMDLYLFFYTLVLLIGVHAICDYPLQGDFLAKAKKDGPLPLYHLGIHCIIHAAGVLIVTSSLSLAILEFFFHMRIDSYKNKDQLSFGQDQALHIICKVAIALIYCTAVSNKILPW